MVGDDDGNTHSPQVSGQFVLTLGMFSHRKKVFVCSTQAQVLSLPSQYPELMRKLPWLFKHGHWPHETGQFS